MFKIFILWPVMFVLGVAATGTALAVIGWLGCVVWLLAGMK